MIDRQHLYEIKIKQLLPKLMPYVIGVIVAFAVSGAIMFLMGFDVIRAYSTIVFTSFGSFAGFAETLLKFTPISLLALAYSIPAICSKWNIGGEGQFILGATGATAIGILLADKGIPSVALIPMSVVVGTLFSTFWAAIPAWLLYRFGVSEILTTVLLNFTSFQVVDYVTTVLWHDPTAGHETTFPTAKESWLPLLIQSPPLHLGIVFAVIGTVAIYLYVTKTVKGYELKATGANPRSSKVFGINVNIMALLSLLVGGAFAGLAGSIEVMGVHHRLIVGMQSNFAVLGVMVGLISRNNLKVIPFVAFLIAVLEIGAGAMQRTLMIPVEMVFITEALIVLVVLFSETLRRH